MKYRIAIVDDHPLISEGVQNLITQNSDLQLVGSFVDATHFLLDMRSTEIDLVLLDISLPDMDGIDLCLQIKRSKPQIIVVGLSNHAEKSAVMKMLQNGASGYILKNTPPDELIDCIYRALQGQLVFSSSIQQIMAKPELSLLSTNMQLTTREKEVLKLLAQGLTGIQIAEKLFLSKFTVENHRKNMLRKMNVNNVASLIVEGTKMGLL
ncbi:response regulator [Sphingobacterium detergens]|uniref:LuxR family two component transcriptional regulator n=1 Tax=Sphingobacterium detergens TaxID=1145106 RepID=A0A420BGG8_SPHD1|nr:response regulator transcription factor [Sphingobacterium detergens]RKE55790.1 LuxR family two component transcriptional regulator [Sphingobacterium detergens]